MVRILDRMVYAALVAGMLAGCSQQGAPAPSSESSGGNTAQTSSGVAESEAARPLPPLVPESLGSATTGDLELSGELGCAFLAPGGREALFLGAADVADDAIASAAMRFGGEVVKLRLAGRGGFSALSKGGRFEGANGLFVNIVPSGDPVRETPQIAEESPRRPALMVLSRDGQELSIEGFYECGP